MDLTTEAVRVALDVSQTRAWVASANIAQANVPGAGVYRASFATALNALQQAADGGHDAASLLGAVDMQSVRADVHLGSTGASGVQLDDEVAQLNEAGANYQALTNGLSRHYALMQLAIAGS